MATKLGRKVSKIIILMPYFGKWPFWIELFLEGCRRNSTINWHFFSDCGLPERLPANVAYQEMSFIEYKQLVQERLGINFNPNNAYKICDIRPAFGFIHSDVIRGYDFWAFGDLDLVYGDLRAVYKESYLSRYDLVSNHATRVSGHLCFIRNSFLMNEQFRKIPNWKEKFSDLEHCAVDERAFSKLFVKHKNLPAWIRKPLVWLLYPVSRKCSFIERYTTPDGCIAWKDGDYLFPKEWFWDGEKISNSFQTEPGIPYFHFAIWKKSSWNNLSADQYVPYIEDKTYRFSSSGIDMI